MNGNRNGDNTIELLIVDQSLNDAEKHISTLRNASLAVHANRVTDESTLLEALEQEDIDLIICSADHTELELPATQALCARARPDLPLVVIYKDQDPEVLLQAMREGARDVVAMEDDEHLQLVIKRELSDLRTRQKLKLVSQKLHDAELRCTSLIEHSRDAIAYIHEGMHVHANSIYLEMFGYVDLDEIEGLPILDLVTSKDHKRLKAFLRSLGSETTRLEVVCEKSNSDTFEATLEFSPATVDGEPCTQIIIRDQSISKELENKLALLTSQDLQTGLMNRQYFMNTLDEKVSSLKSGSASCSLFYLVMDNFQNYRSSVGVANSDKLLKKIAESIKETIDSDEIVAKFGDHTFTILSNKTASLEVEPMAELLRSTVEELPDSQAENSTCSIGIAVFDNTTPNSQEFINHAYQACETARSAGGNSFALYDAKEMQPSYGEEHGASESDLNDLIRHALEQDRFRLVYQPIVSLQGDTRENYAVLTRLLDNNDEEILPSYFMKAAEEGSQMADIDRWVIKHAIENLANERQEGRKVNFFVNISGASLEDESLLLWVCDCLREYKAKGAWLTFQIKDNDLRTHTQSAKKLIDGLKKIKCQIALDQYGTNQKSEMLLKHLPIDYVKFDQNLLQNLANTQQLQDTLKQLNTSAISHSVKTIALGIEDANSLAILWTVGVNYIQGHFLQEPSINISYDFNST